MADEPHDVVKLLVARMESHPEEFSSDKERYSDRWERYISEIEVFGNEADKAALNAKLRDIWMVKIHEKVMDELCNGEERRRKAREEQEYERNLSKSLAFTQQQIMQQSYQGLQNATALGQYQNAMLGIGTTAPSTKLDVQSLAGQSPTQSGPLNSIKKALGI
jgi:hypothetical protein